MIHDGFSRSTVQICRNVQLSLDNNLDQTKPGSSLRPTHLIFSTCDNQTMHRETNMILDAQKEQARFGVIESLGNERTTRPNKYLEQVDELCEQV